MINKSTIALLARQVDEVSSQIDHATEIGAYVQRADLITQCFMALSGSEPDTGIRDLLGDLMHWCDANGVDFFGELEHSQEAYRMEVQDALELEGSE